MPVDRYPKGKSFYGVLDMAGNVWEWTSSIKKDYPYKSDDGREDPAAAERRVVRGGSFDVNQYGVGAAARSRGDSDVRSYGVGFRVLAPGSRSSVSGRLWSLKRLCCAATLGVWGCAPAKFWGRRKHNN